MKVIVGLSGGVDSSVAAYLLLKQGYEVEGLFMRNWDSLTNQDLLGNPDISKPVCSQEEDYNDALAVADKLGIPLHRVDFIEEYWAAVFQPFLAEHEAGRTPNPDILCNKYIKFDAFIAKAKALGADKIAMGHYARVEERDGKFFLLRGLDGNKDQTYFLSQMPPQQLAMTLFPIGDLRKSEVRAIAKEQGFVTATKKDSTGICFIGERHYKAFLGNYFAPTPGPIVSADGVVLGKHQGLMGFTIGQRRGMAIGGTKKFGVEPWFVVGKQQATNKLIIGQGEDHPLLFANIASVSKLNWLVNDVPKKVTAKFRYRQADIDCGIQVMEDDRIVVTMDQPVRAVTPGQAAVFYDGEVCLGGGFIDEVYMNQDRREYV
jgi:tRNA-specific 2-thiouridylase